MKKNLLAIAVGFILLLPTTAIAKTAVDTWYAWGSDGCTCYKYTAYSDGTTASEKVDSSNCN